MRRAEVTHQVTRMTEPGFGGDLLDTELRFREQRLRRAESYLSVRLVRRLADVPAE